MIPFRYEEPQTLALACSQIDHTDSMAIAGGTTMIDLMKLNVLTPKSVVHVRKILPSTVIVRDNRLVIGAACTMANLADHPLVNGKFPVVRQSLILAASPQIRNMATLGGNLLQRTRSTYFRHTDMPVEYDSRQKSESVGLDDAIFGKDVETSLLAVFGNNGRLVGMYPGDFAVTFVAFGGQLVLASPHGERTVAAQEFFQAPNDTFQYTTVLKPNEVIKELHLPLTETLTNSFYHKVRERSSYAFALASCSVGLQLDGNRIVAANVGLGGLAPIPWHSKEAEKMLVGQMASDETFARAAEAALAEANPPSGLEFKVPLAKNTILRALQIVRDQGPLSDEQLWAMQHGRG
jgi:xanthine dehydrogenase YagS FAD-binding subunit